MNVDRMLEMCRRGQWEADDLDWSVEPRPMSREDEIAIVQYFTDMSGIELLAKKLFEVQRDRTDDPTLKGIFDSFVTDEQRHSEVAARLARHYDVHQYRAYEMNPALAAFGEPFVDLVRHLSSEVASIYVTGGELLLDVALLRSINDFVDDEMSQQAMDRINRDESRHIAVDYHMTEYYASPEGIAREALRPPPTLDERVKGWVAMARVFYYTRPFFKDVFLRPMDHVDPEGRRLREAVKRGQLLLTKPSVAERPFTRFVGRVLDLANHPVLGTVFTPLAMRVVGLDASLVQTLYSDEEAAWAQKASFDEMAKDAVSAKRLN